MPVTGLDHLHLYHPIRFAVSYQRTHQYSRTSLDGIGSRDIAEKC
jgi:hypothetical protein